jgi:hypothetical protein
MNAPGDGFTIEVHACHNDDAAISPVIGCGKDTAMPEREDGAMTGTQDFIEV